ncbi:MAG TPA: ORF6N domain-containing protein [Planctomycetota bacterium]|nr:ORF6N domain-containing protein [Planctomycetota bacterium]
MAKHEVALPAAQVESVILTVRGHKVILDSDLAALYGVTTRQLNQQVKRNQDRFPNDFAFVLRRRQ